MKMLSAFSLILQMFWPFIQQVLRRSCSVPRHSRNNWECDGQSLPCLGLTDGRYKQEGFNCRLWLVPPITDGQGAVWRRRDYIREGSSRRASLKWQHLKWTYGMRSSHHSYARWLSLLGWGNSSPKWVLLAPWREGSEADGTGAWSMGVKSDTIPWSGIQSHWVSTRHSRAWSRLRVFH